LRQYFSGQRPDLWDNHLMPSEKSSTLLRTVRILDCFTPETPQLGVRQAARRLGLSTSAAGRLMQSMKEVGILTQDPSTRMYAVGTRVLTWAGMYLATSDVRNLALPYLQELLHETQETVSLYAREGHERVCIERLESSRSVAFVARVGRRLPIYAGAAGKVLLAFLSQDQQHEILTGLELTPVTPRTLVDPRALRQELETIRRQGYAVSRGEYSLDASGVAAPIFSQSGGVVAAITISGPSQRFTDDVIQDYIEKVVRVTGNISRALGYSRYPVHSLQMNEPERL
jgi:IclR family transcriptional regulator, KDG regulon repressor